MSAAMVEPRRPGDTDLHRRQRSKNLITVVLLLLVVAAFFALTIVRMGDKL
jgi:Tfp pilus assembly protein PilX